MCRTILSKSSSEQPPTREHFVFTDTDGLLYHFLIEGNMVKDGSKIPPDVRTCNTESTFASLWKSTNMC